MEAHDIRLGKQALDGNLDDAVDGVTPLALGADAPSVGAALELVGYGANGAARGVRACG